jgi:NAD(P)-dependent dehydrogenase (short-subunit alcohol dehydrogenase family)
MDPRGQTAIVSRGASGLGRATAVRLHAAGMDVGIHDRNEAEAQRIPIVQSPMLNGEFFPLAGAIGLGQLG